MHTNTCLLRFSPEALEACLFSVNGGTHLIVNAGNCFEVLINVCIIATGARALDTRVREPGYSKEADDFGSAGEVDESERQMPYGETRHSPDCTARRPL